MKFRLNFSNLTNGGSRNKSSHVVVSFHCSYLKQCFYHTVLVYAHTDVHEIFESSIVYIPNKWYSPLIAAVKRYNSKCLCMCMCVCVRSCMEATVLKAHFCFFQMSQSLRVDALYKDTTVAYWLRPTHIWWRNSRTVVSTASKQKGACVGSLFVLWLPPTVQRHTS